MVTKQGKFFLLGKKFRNGQTGLAVTRWITTLESFTPKPFRGLQVPA
jgi:hypothetical protein